MGPERKARRRRMKRRITPLLSGAVVLLLLLLGIRGLFSRATMPLAIDGEKSRLVPPTSTTGTSHHSTKTSSSTTTEQSNGGTLFHEARTDRSGATIHDMLLAHAYAFQQNQTYGGACATQPLVHLQAHLQMIETLGLGHVLRFACPDDPNETSTTIVDRHLYTRFGTRIWTAKWLEHIRAQQQQQDGTQSDQNSNHDKRRVVAHIRRGDVDLCDPETKDRYLSNQHYLGLLALHSKKSDHVSIFSELKSTEGWEDFQNHDDDYNLQLDQPPTLAWKEMMTADVLILSKSSFSIVPALFNRKGVVVYTPFWVQPLGHWTVVDDATDRASQRAAIRLQLQLCG